MQFDPEDILNPHGKGIEFQRKFNLSMRAVQYYFTIMNESTSLGRGAGSDNFHVTIFFFFPFNVGLLTSSHNSTIFQVSILLRKVVNV